MALIGVQCAPRHRTLHVVLSADRVAGFEGVDGTMPSSDKYLDGWQVTLSGLRRSMFS